MEDVKINAAAIREIVALHAKAGQPITTEMIHAVIVPKDSTLESLRNLQYPNGYPPDKPHHIMQAVQLRDAASLTAYYKLFSTPTSRIFAEPGSSTVTALLDYHNQDAKSAEFVSHKAVFAMTFDDRWKIWNGNDEKPIAQAEFAEFLEDNITDIAEPPAADLLEVARNLTATISGNFSSKIKPSNGSVQLSWTETVEGKMGSGTLDIPESFTLNIPVYFGEQPIPIRARLRYRVNGGALKFHYKLYRKSEILQAAFDTAVSAIEQELGATVLLGSAA